MCSACAYGSRPTPSAAIGRHSREQLAIGGDAPAGARCPGVAGEYPIPGVVAHRPGERAVAEELVEPVAERSLVTRLDQVARLSVLDDLGEAPDPTGDDGRPARHRFQHAQ